LEDFILKKAIKFQKEKRKMRVTIFRILFFLLCQMIFIGIFSVWLVFYGPFTNIRDTFVTTAMTTMSHQYLARFFLSDKKIDEIMAKNSDIVKLAEQDPNTIKVSNTKTDKGTEGIEVIDIKKSHFNGKLMVVKNPKRIAVGATPNIGKYGAPLSEIVKSNNAIGGINAGAFVDDKMIGTGGLPRGIIVQNGGVTYSQAGYKYFQIVGIDDKGVLIIRDKMSINDIKKAKIQWAISFGPPLIINGQRLVSGGSSMQPRTAIGQRKDGSILLLTIDGRSISSPGATLKELQNVLFEYGAYNATNVDGGSSTTMVYQGKVINSPSDILGERSISSAFIVR
jgi:exopolysaccharide biosynthesis protein